MFICNAFICVYQNTACGSPCIVSNNGMVCELRVRIYIEEGDQGQISERRYGFINTVANFKGSVTAVKSCFTRETINFSTKFCAVIRSCKQLVDRFFGYLTILFQCTLYTMSRSMDRTNDG